MKKIVLHEKIFDVSDFEFTKENNMIWFKTFEEVFGKRLLEVSGVVYVKPITLWNFEETFLIVLDAGIKKGRLIVSLLHLENSLIARVKSTLDYSKQTNQVLEVSLKTISSQYDRKNKQIKK